jgi:FAD synthase
MESCDGWDLTPDAPYGTIGKFDGLHRGHQHLTELTKQRAGDRCPSAVITFDLITVVRAPINRSPN